VAAQAARNLGSLTITQHITKKRANAVGENKLKINANKTQALTGTVPIGFVRTLAKLYLF
jgi:hypothetical protein